MIPKFGESITWPPYCCSEMYFIIYYGVSKYLVDRNVTLRTVKAPTSLWYNNTGANVPKSIQNTVLFSVANPFLVSIHTWPWYRFGTAFQCFWDKTLGHFLNSRGGMPPQEVLECEKRVFLPLITLIMEKVLKNCLLEKFDEFSAKRWVEDAVDDHIHRGIHHQKKMAAREKDKILKKG